MPVCLSITDSGFDYSVLSEFRVRLLKGGRENQLLDSMLEQFKQEGWIKTRGKMRTDSTHILGATRQLNRLECVGETLRQALNELATVAPQWLLNQVSSDWFDRYSIRFEQYRQPKTKAEQEELVLIIGNDGHHLLAALEQSYVPVGLGQLSAVETLRQVWIQQYNFQDGHLVWRTSADLPPNQLLIQSPYDTEARNRTKRDTNWTGYAVHLTETCDEELPCLITNVETTPATTFDGAMTQVIHQALDSKDLLPSEHFVDTAYVDSGHLVTSQADHNIDLIGPARLDTCWQAQSNNGFDLSSFAIDWQAQSCTCPAGNTNVAWRPKIDDRGNQVIEVRFAASDCRVCTLRCLRRAAPTQCTRAKHAPRLLKLRPLSQHEALQTARERQATSEFKQQYQQRAGVEGLFSQASLRFELRRSRYIGRGKTHLQHIFIAAAINLTRLVSWLEGVPKTKTRQSRFAALALAASAS
jgi:transposase